MCITKLLVANEWRSYQEAIAGIVELERPDIEVIRVNWMNLDAEITKQRPQFVICNRITPAMESAVPFWIELHPDDGPVSRVGFGGEVRIIQNLEVSDILGVLDEALLALEG
ncbi:hypothetical protein [Rubrobacter indicoceani]|uniref:hypothetical protein n=1 Tax=Rubrobacter indicoceani TaxID=2051957 RepID=UPI000E5C42E1|nr:hypothetical protein [Rubrobacter indicoceani]